MPSLLSSKSTPIFFRLDPNLQEGFLIQAAVNIHLYQANLRGRQLYPHHTKHFSSLANFPIPWGRTDTSWLLGDAESALLWTYL